MNNKEQNPWYKKLPTDPYNPTPTKVKKKGLPLWAWIVSGVVIVGIGFGIFAFVRFNSFKNDTFGGRNEASLLPTNTPKPTPTLAPRTTQAGKIVSVPTIAPVPTATPIPQETDPLIRKIKQGEKISVLVMGYGGGNHDGGYLTDTIMQIVFDPEKKAVSMINIPRDTWVNVPINGLKNGFWGKANSAFAYIMNLSTSQGISSRYRFNPEIPNSQIDAAALITRDVVENITGVPVDYWAAVSFDGFRDFIDAIGGIYVNVETPFDDYEYPRNDDPNIDPGVMHIHFDAGQQLMKGEKAIQYSRSRHSLQDGSDFGRSKRQMNVVAAVKEQVAKPDILLKTFPIMSALQGKVRTSLSFDQTLTLANYFRSSEGSSLMSNLIFAPFVLSNANFLNSDTTSDGAFILVPKEGEGNYKAIQEWIRNGLKVPQLRAENLRVQIQNATGQYVYANTATEIVRNYGLTVDEPLVANSQIFSEIVDYSNGKGKETVKALKNLFPNASIRPADLPYKGYVGPAVVVVLGKNYSQQPSPAQDKSGGTDNSYREVRPK